MYLVTKDVMKEDTENLLAYITKWIFITANEIQKGQKMERFLNDTYF